MNNENYNGWHNRETWIVNLWLTNDEILYNRSRGLSPTELFELVDGETNTEGFMLDLVHAAMSRVHWSEIAESLNAE